MVEKRTNTACRPSAALAENLPARSGVQRQLHFVTSPSAADWPKGIRVSGVRVRKRGKLTFDPSLAPASVDRCTPAAHSALGDLTASTARQADTHQPTRRAGLIASHPSQDVPARRMPGSLPHAPGTSSVQLAPRKHDPHRCAVVRRCFIGAPSPHANPYPCSRSSTELTSKLIRLAISTSSTTSTLRSPFSIFDT